MHYLFPLPVRSCPKQHIFLPCCNSRATL